MKARRRERGEGIVAVIVVLIFFILAGAIAAKKLAEGTKQAANTTKSKIESVPNKVNIPDGIGE